MNKTLFEQNNTFFRLYNDLLMETQFSNYRYTIPKDLEHVLIDFYSLINIDRKAEMPDLGKPRKQGFHVPDSELEGMSDEQKNDLGVMDTSEHNDEMDYVREEAIKTLVEFLLPEMTKSITFANAAEFRHILDQNSPETLKEFFTKNEAYSFYKEYVREYNLRSMHKFGKMFTPREEGKGRYKDDEKQRRHAHYAIKTSLKRSGMSWVKFCEVSENAFNELSWSNQYGGPKWGNISKGLKFLIEAADKDLQTKIIAIDHAYDLQHNTDTVFNKLVKYAKDGGYSWIMRRLEQKKNIKNYYVWVDNSSPGLKPFLYALIKNYYGISRDQFDEIGHKAIQQDKTETTKEIAAVYDNPKEQLYIYWVLDGDYSISKIDSNEYYFYDVNNKKWIEDKDIGMPFSYSNAKYYEKSKDGIIINQAAFDKMMKGDPQSYDLSVVGMKKFMETQKFPMLYGIIVMLIRLHKLYNRQLLHKKIILVLQIFHHIC